MLLLQGRAPARVIDDGIEEDFGAEGVGGVGQLAELIDAGGALVELDEGRVDGQEVLYGIGTSKSTKASTGGGRGGDGQEMQDAAAEPSHDMRELRRQVAQLAGRRNDR